MHTFLELNHLQRNVIILDWRSISCLNVLTEITHRPALGTMRLIARKMLYVRCVGLCLRSLHKLTSTWQKKINIHHSFETCLQLKQCGISSQINLWGYHRIPEVNMCTIFLFRIFITLFPTSASQWRSG